MQICAAHRPNVGNPPTLPLPAKRHSLWLNWPTLRTRRVRQPTNSEQVQTYLHQVAKTIKCSTMSPNLWLDSLRPQGHWLGFIAGPFKFGTVVIDRISDSCLCSYDRAVTRVLFRSVLSELQCPLPLTSCISYLGGLILTVDSDDLASPGGLSLTGGIFLFCNASAWLQLWLPRLSPQTRHQIQGRLPGKRASLPPPWRCHYLEDLVWFQWLVIGPLDLFSLPAF